MNIDLTSTIITSISSVIVGYFSHLAGQRHAGALSRKEIREAQLSKVFEPIDKLLFYSQNDDPKSTLNELVDIVSGSYRLVPQIIHDEVAALISCEHLEMSSFDKLHIIEASYYNWTKRSLGYPYDPTAICREYCPEARKHVMAQEILNAAFVLIYLFDILFLGVVLLMAFSGYTMNVPQWAFDASVYIAVLGSFVCYMFIKQNRSA